MFKTNQFIREVLNISCIMLVILFKYDLDDNEGKTRFRYSYDGFEKIDDSYANMNYTSYSILNAFVNFSNWNLRSFWLV